MKKGSLLDSLNKKMVVRIADMMEHSEAPAKVGNVLSVER
jgi:hypothetical protein